MFERREITAELASRLEAAGLDPTDPTVQAITSIVSAYFAEQTAEVLKQVRAVLDKIGTDGLH
jgi:enamine deaminase RidA (YjgF/YER057c/UK114 family)